MNEWAKTVKRVYDENKHKDGYKLKDAMHDAKAVYKPVAKKEDVKKSVKKSKKTKKTKGKSAKNKKGKK